MLATAAGFPCLRGSAIGVSAGHSSGCQLAGAQVLVIMSLHNSAGAQGTFRVHFLGFCEPHHVSVVDPGGNVWLVRRSFNSQEVTAN